MHANACHTAAGLPSVLADEPAWRQLPYRSSHRALDHVAIGHWADGRIGRRELTAPVFDGHYTVSILLGRASVDCYKNGRLLARGTGGPGGLQLTAPGERVVCAFRGENEALHLFFPAVLVEAEHGAAPRLDDPAFRVDPLLVPFAQRCASARERGGLRPGSRPDGNDAVREILHHVLSRYVRESARATQTRGLSRPRLRRVVDYIDANLAEPLTLHDIALHAGLSRMHFAAQFRLATGRTPHAFLMERRIERAKSLISQGMTIAEVAQAVGFQGQAHFTTVFCSLIGMPPGRWRTERRHRVPRCDETGDGRNTRPVA
ncbi:hypothetical protein CY652_03620 [Burkholderia sp. WAC0059]|uniref:helix-turn-helix domain-containing protein n=1 Tax=Burkholderia sp. WAC0059 TaxID=2066022 RepID=UPI000C7F48D5|nr:AraC family transcriptional regulator [Burkholderia sp. WAC0059]PLZ04062.1 hypothetical protein CY652_03620 [Burkholderia sp. WAC0059]